jgi:light-regulated signal transduction histidine kinase (bacteriophytochrome)
MVEETVKVRVNDSRTLEEISEELEHLLYVVSHDLPEPLRMVTGYLGLIERRYQDALGEEGREFIHYAVDGSQRMQEMLQALLMYSRTGRKELELEILDMNDVIKQACDKLEYKIGETNAQVLYDNLPRVAGDADQIYQLITNLLDNAIKFHADTPPVISIKFDRDESNIEGMLQFSVIDNGIGFPAEHGERIFKLFQCLHPREHYEGSGVGLALCRNIVQRHGGKIEAGAIPRKGAVFSFTLPGEL